MEKRHKHLYEIWTHWTWPKFTRSKHNGFQSKLDHMDVLDALEQIEEQEQKQEFFRLTEKIREFGMKGVDLAILPELLETDRERALYEALMEVIKHSQSSLLYTKQGYS
jgi:hypothetical protein